MTRKNFTRAGRLPAMLRQAAIYAAVFLPAGCGSDTGSPDDDGRVPLEVKCGIDVLSRAADNTWDDGDAIGIFMLDGDTPEAANRKYTTAAGGKNGTFSAADGQTIYFPTDGSARDFAAYYPYRETLAAGNVYTVDVSTQAVQADIDLTSAARVTGKTKNAPEVAFEFRHRLVKLYLTIQPDGTSLTAPDLARLTVTLTHQRTRATFDAVAGNAVNIDTDVPLADIPLLTSADGTRAEGIVLPAEDTDGMTLLFRLADSSPFTWAVKNAPLSRQFNAGSKYVYTITLGRTAMNVTSSVTGWTPGNGNGNGESGNAE